MKLKEEKDAKRTQLDSRHQYLFGSIGAKLGLEESEVENFVLEGNQVGWIEPRPVNLLVSCIP